MNDLTFTCPVCGADVPRRAKSCPDCGACEKSGWSDNRYLDGAYLPEDFHSAGELPGPRGRSGPPRLWLVVALIIIVAMVWMTLRGLW